LGGATKSIDGPVSNIDIFPTVLKYMGVKGDYDSFFDGDSVFLDGRPFQASFAPWSNRARFNSNRFSILGILDYNQVEAKKKMAIFELVKDGKIYGGSTKDEIKEVIKREFLSRQPWLAVRVMALSKLTAITFIVRHQVSQFDARSNPFAQMI
jgi:hypothetical protein